MNVDCPIHGEHEAYEGFRMCPFIDQKARLIARDIGEEPIHVISTGKIQRGVKAERLGLIERQGEYL
jgi:hypothetical protein